MAPRKRKAEGEGEATEKSQAKVALTSTTRVTRSSTRLANSGKPPAKLPEKKTKKKQDKVETKNETLEQAKLETQTASEAAPENESESNVELDKKDSVTVEEAGQKKTIVIEYCKQCKSFKTRAIQVKDGLEEAFDGITVQLNPDNPRRGCFEIREEGGDKFISLLNMKRPFKPMKDLDMDKVISDITGKLK